VTKPDEAYGDRQKANDDARALVVVREGLPLGVRAGAKVGVSLVQRRLCVGYVRARAALDRLVEQGLIEDAGGQSYVLTEKGRAAGGLS
jgi:Ftsk gamma domain.